MGKGVAEKRQEGRLIHKGNSSRCSPTLLKDCKTGIGSSKSLRTTSHLDIHIKMCWTQTRKVSIVQFVEGIIANRQ